MAYYKDHGSYQVETLELPGGLSLGLYTSAVICGGGEDSSAPMARAAWFNACDHLEMSGPLCRRDLHARGPAHVTDSDWADSSPYIARLPLIWGSSP